MAPWKTLLIVTLLLVPGGSLVLLVLATAKALKASRDRLLSRPPMPVPVLPVPQPAVVSDGGKG